MTVYAVHGDGEPHPFLGIPEYNLWDLVDQYVDTIWFWVEESWEDLFGTLQYKPNFSWKVHPYAGIAGSDVIVVTMMVDDSRGKKLGKIPVRINRILPPYGELPDEARQQIVRGLFKEIELHEMDEHLRFDGDLLFDPHKGS